jgi:hypothetical protein
MPAELEGGQESDDSEWEVGYQELDKSESEEPDEDDMSDDDEDKLKRDGSESEVGYQELEQDEDLFDVVEARSVEYLRLA